MNTKKMQAVEKFKKLATASFDTTKQKIANGTLHEMYKTKLHIEQTYDEIQNNVMREFFGSDYYEHVDKVGEIGDAYEALCDLRGDFTYNEFELVNNS